MTGLNRQEALFLFIGDIVIFISALWLTLFIRYTSVPKALFNSHIFAFAPLIILWLAIFFIAGLYERHTMLLQNRLPSIILRTQIVNGFVAIAFFYFWPNLDIAPKTVLFIYFVVSSVAAVIWRVYGYRLMSSKHKENAMLIGAVDELRELEAEVNHNNLYPIRFVSSIDFDDVGKTDVSKNIVERVSGDKISVIAIDIDNEKVKPILPNLYNLVFSNVRFISLHKLYEGIFKRIPVSLLRYNWFLENISNRRKPLFDFFKRLMDIIFSLVVGAVSLIFYPFVILAIKLDDGGAIFSVQERVGKDNKIIKVYKFRTMTIANDGGEWNDKIENKITRTGAFLRRTRIDELPQLLNVLKGDLSLIGPRPEFSRAVLHYQNQIPFYAVRHLIKPGLSGWAQIFGEHPHHGIGTDETMNKLSYDLYYINNRSYFLDLEIALKTIRILLSFKGK